jgi:hypothetical protein
VSTITDITLNVQSTQTETQGTGTINVTIRFYIRDPPPVFTVQGDTLVNNQQRALSLTIVPNQTVDLNNYITVSNGATLTYTINVGTVSLSGSTITSTTNKTAIIKVSSRLTSNQEVGDIFIYLTLYVRVPRNTNPSGSIFLSADGPRQFGAIFIRGNTLPAGPGQFIADISNNILTFIISPDPFNPDIVTYCNFIASSLQTRKFMNIIMTNSVVTMQYRITYAIYSHGFWRLSTSAPTVAPATLLAPAVVTAPATILAPTFFTGDTVSLYGNALTPAESLPPPDAVCFAEGTKILCDNGVVRIENLRVGMKVKTLKHGYKEVTMIGKSTIFNPGGTERIRERLYIYPTGLRITGGHSILVETANADQLAIMRKSFGRLFITEGCFRLMAKDDPHAQPYERRGTFNIYNFALGANETLNYGVFADEILVESSFPYWIRKRMEVI